MSCQCKDASGCTPESTEDSPKFEELGAFIEEHLRDAGSFDRRRGILIQVLHRAQHIFGYLPESVQSFVSKKMSISRADIYGVISFYSYFTDKPVGRYKINVCTGTACFVKGAPKVLNEFKRLLNLEEAHSSPDGKFFLGALRCVGACSLAPVVMVNDKVYGNMTAEKVADVLKECTD